VRAIIKPLESDCRPVIDTFGDSIVFRLSLAMSYPIPALFGAAIRVGRSTTARFHDQTNAPRFPALERGADTGVRMIVAAP